MPRRADNRRQQDTLPPGAWASIPRVCAHLGLGRTAVVAAIQRGELLATRLGKRIVVNVESLMRQLESAAIATAIDLASPDTDDSTSERENEQ